MKKTLFILLSFILFHNFQMKGQEIEDIQGPSFCSPSNYFHYEDRYYIYNEKAIYYSEDKGNSWKFLNNSNTSHIISDVACSGEFIYVHLSNVSDINFVKGELFQVDKDGQNWKKIPTEIESFKVVEDKIFVNQPYPNYGLKVYDSKLSLIYSGPIQSSNIYVYDAVKYKDEYFFSLGKNIYKTKDFVSIQDVFKYDYRTRFYIIKDSLFLYNGNQINAESDMYKWENSKFNFVYKTQTFNTEPRLTSYNNEYIAYAYPNSELAKISKDKGKTFTDITKATFNNGFVFFKVMDADNAFFLSNNDLYIVDLKNFSFKKTTSNLRLYNYGIEALGQNNDLFVKAGSNFHYYSKFNFWQKEELKWNTYAYINDNTVVLLIPNSTSVIVSNLADFSKKNYNLPSVCSRIKKIDNLILAYGSEVFASIDTCKTWVSLGNNQPDYYFGKAGKYYIKTGQFAQSFFSSDLVNWKVLNASVEATSPVYLNDDEILYTVVQEEIIRTNNKNGSKTKGKLPLTSAKSKKIAFDKNFFITCIDGHGIFWSINEGVTWTKIKNIKDDISFQNMVLTEQYIYVNTYTNALKIDRSTFDLINIKGNVFGDSNNNKVKDEKESWLPKVKLSTQSKFSFITGQEGDFDIYIDKNEDINVNLQKGITSTYKIASLDRDTSLLVGLVIDSSYADLSTFIVPAVFRPGFESSINLIVGNSAFKEKYANVELELDEKISVINYTPMFSRKLNNILYWDSIKLNVNEIANIHLEVKVDSTVLIGTKLNFLLKSNYTDLKDDDLTNNVFELEDEVVGAYDPNDKLVYPNGNIDIQKYKESKKMIYTIRFQNTGNYPASFVRIIDSLSSKYNVSNFEYLGSSYRNTWSIKNNVLNIQFKDINLPDSTENLALSQGYFMFSIDLRDSLNLGDEIRNRAYIYFDYNAPVITDYAYNKIVEQLRNKEISEIEDLIIFPNPSSEFVQVKIDNIYDAMEVYDQNGLLLSRSTFHQNISKIDIGYLPSGTYFLVLKNQKQMGIGKFVKI